MRGFRWTVTLATALLLGACNDIPMGGTNSPVEEARHAQPRQVRVASAQPEGEGAREVVLDGQRFVPSGAVLDAPDRLVRSVGTAGGQTLYTLAWDAAPYDRLLARRADGRWQQYLPVVGSDRPGGAHGAAAAHGTPSAAGAAEPQADAAHGDTAAAAAADTAHDGH